MATVSNTGNTNGTRYHLIKKRTSDVMCPFLSIALICLLLDKSTEFRMGNQSDSIIKMEADFVSSDFGGVFIGRPMGSTNNMWL